MRRWMKVGLCLLTGSLILLIGERTSTGINDPPRQPQQPCSSPSITSQPSSQTKCSGQTASFSVSASDVRGYQWQKNGTNLVESSNISGTTSATLTLGHITGAAAGSYNVLLANGCGWNLVSGTAALTVNTASAPSITSQPSNQTVCAGQTANFTLTATNASSYQWRKNGANLFDGSTGHGSTYSGSTTAALRISNVSTADTVSASSGFDCIASNTCSLSVTSSMAALTVNVIQSVTASNNGPISAGNTLKLSVSTVAGATYSWTGPNGFTSTVQNPSIANATTAASGIYTVIVTVASCGSAMGTTTGTVAYTPSLGSSLPVITTQPQSQAVTAGSNVTFNVTATGTAPLSYQWRKNGSKLANGGDVSGAQTNTLTLTNVKAFDAGIYTVTISNASGSVVSSCAALRVFSPFGVVAWGACHGGVCIVPSDLTNAVAIAAGPVDSLALKSDGTVVAWGNDYYGQTNVPAGLANVVGIAGGLKHGLALKSDGTVVAWGDNTHGQTNLPSSLTNVVAIAAGAYHNLALKADGTVVAWGWNILGLTNVPSSATNVVGIASGMMHSLALKGDGTVVAWGENDHGQINVPSGLTNVVGIAAGADHSLALKGDGTVVAWGYNDNGQTNVPSNLTNVVVIAAGGEHNLALKSDGTVVGFGYNMGGVTDVPSGLTNVVGIAAGMIHCLALGNFPPVITAQPTNQTVYASQTASITAAANGSPAPTVQWQVSTDGGATFANISGATNATLTLITSELDNNKQYHAVFGNAYGNATSTAATLTVAPSPNLVAWWKLDEGRGTSAADSSGNGNNGSLSNNPTWGTGILGNALYFDGFSDQHVQVQPWSTVNGTFTVAAWVSPLALYEDMAAFGTVKWAYNPVFAFGLSLGGAVEAGINDCHRWSGWAVDSFPYTTGTWYHITYVVTPTNYTAYADGAVVGSKYYDYAVVPLLYDGDCQIKIGSLYSSYWKQFNGGIEDVRVYNRALTANEVAALYNVDTIGDGIPNWWRQQYFGSGSTTNSNSCASCDPDDDGFTNLQEYQAGTDPLHPPGLSFSPEGGTYLTAQPVTISCAIAGATIHYTTNGLAPTESDPVIVSGRTVTVSALTMLRACAFKSGMSPTDTKSGLYQIGPCVVAGLNYSLALQTNGTLWAWGKNADYGQLGDGTIVNRSYPAVVSGVSNVWVVSAGETHTVAADTNGTVWTWGGFNNYGQLGNGTYAPCYRPLAINGVNKVVSVAAGENHTMALRSDGTVWTWGHNGFGQLGIGANGPSTTNAPVQVVGLTHVIGIAAGAWYSVALRSDGTVWTWGHNDRGQLGNGTTMDQPVPELVEGVSDVVAIAAGYYHTAALCADGTVRAWGCNDDGQLGDGTGAEFHAPVQVIGLSNVVAIAAGKSHMLAVTTNDNIYSWGKNDYGELGLGNNDNQSTPQQISSLSGMQSISGGYHSLAVKSDGTIWAWGYNGYGQLGQCTTVQYVNTPVKVNLSITSSPPVMATVSGSTNICLGGYAPATITWIPITAVLTGTGPWTVTWSDGVTQNNILTSPVTHLVNPNTTTNYTVTAVSDSTCRAGVASGSATVTVGTIISQPTSLNKCLNQSASFTVAAGGTVKSYQWLKNGGTLTGSTTATFNIGSVTAGNAGSYSVVVSNGCGKVTSSVATLTVNTASAPSINSQPTSQIACVHQTASFTLTASNASNYQWRKNGVNLSNGSTDNGSVCSGVNSATLQISNVATADTVLASSGFDCVVSNACSCSVTSSMVGLTVSSPPTAVVVGNAKICGGSSTTIQTTLTGIGPWTVTWSDGVTSNNITVNTATRTVSPTESTTYTVTTLSDSKCGNGTSSGSAKITVNGKPIVHITPGAATNCVGSSVMLTASGASTYSWSPGTGLDTTDATMVRASPTSTTTYTVTGTDFNGCQNTASVTVTVNPKPIIRVTPGSGTIFCNTGSVTLTASGASTYKWSPVSGLDTNMGATVHASPGQTTTYTVTGTDLNGCQNNVTNVIVTVIQKPIILVTLSAPSICNGGSATLTANGASTYSWSPGTGLDTTSGAVVHASPSATTIYTVTGLSTNGCSNTASMTVKVNPTPTANVTGSTTICNSILTTIQAALTGTGPWTVVWSDGVTNHVSVSPAQRAVSPSSTTVYTVTGLSDSKCAGGISSGSAIITVSSAPAVTLQPNAQTVCAGSVSFMADASGSPRPTAQWQVSTDGGATFANTQSVMTPQLIPESMTTLMFTASPSDSGKQYRVVFNNACGSVTSAPAILMVAPSSSAYAANYQTNTISAASNQAGDYLVGSCYFADVLIVANSGRLSDVGGYLGYTCISTNNMARVTGTGWWTNSGSLYVGFSGSGNSLVITNGGKISDAGGYLGYNSTSSNNSALVTGTGSLWTNLSSLYVGFSGGGNSLVITNGGTVVSATNMFVGYNPGSSNNLVRLDGGNLTVSNVSGTGLLDVRGGTLTINSGSCTVNSLYLTNGVNSALVFNGGTLTTKTVTVANGAVLQFALGTSSHPVVVVNGNLTLGGTLNITNGGGFNTGTYTLFTYTGALTYNGLTIGTTPNSSWCYTINTNTAGTVSLRVAAVSIPLSITTPPSSRTVTNGQPATFSVAARGDPTLSYQWRKNGINLHNNGTISGATLSALAISAVTTNDAGSYDVVVANGCGSVTSGPATLTVIVPLTIISQPLSQDMYSGDTVTFSVGTIGGNTGLTYQWTFNGTNIQGATNSSYTISCAYTNNQGDYAVIVSDGTTSVTSATATLTTFGTGLYSNYVVPVTSSRQDYTFKNGFTYYIYSPIQLYGNTTIEGGAVLKFYLRTNSTLQVMGTLTCKTEQYFPAILTSTDDDAVGEPLWWVSGNGDPHRNYTDSGVPYLDLSAMTTGSVSNLRVCYADIGIVTPAGRLDVWDCQFMDCYTATVAGLGATASLHNVLIAWCDVAVGSVTNFAEIDAEQVTADAATFWSAPTPPSRINLTNSIIMGTLAGGPAISSLDVVLTPPRSIFQQADYGYFYLGTNTYQGAGTANISPQLLAELQNKTTCPPISLPVYMAVGGDMTLSPQVPRYTNGAPDVGYYYPALDYTVAQIMVAPGGRITVEPGTAIAVRNLYVPYIYNPSRWWYTCVGFDCREGSAFISHGTPNKPIVITTEMLVQELPQINYFWFRYANDWWYSAVTFAPDYWPVEFSNDPTAPAPALDFRFTKFYLPTDDYHIWGGYDEDAWTPITCGSATYLSMRDCNVKGGAINLGKWCWYGMDVAGAVDWENNSFENVNINIDPDWIRQGDPTLSIDLAFRAYNNLFRDGTWFHLDPIPASAGHWVVRDNMFDRADIVQYTGQPLDYDHNAYWPLSSSELEYDSWYYWWYLTNTGQLSPSSTGGGGNEQVLTIVPSYQTGPFGNYYLPNTTPLYGNGSQSPGAAGLAQYTTQTNQFKEGSEASSHSVNIGLHYVAVNPLLLPTIQPMDSNNKGIPDYVADANGNSTVDANETDWQYGLADDAYSAVYDDIDLDGDGLTGRAEKILGTNPLVQDNLLTLTPIITGEEPYILTYSMPLSTNVESSRCVLTLLDNGYSAGGYEFIQQTDGTYLVKWNTTFANNGMHVLQVQLGMPGSGLPLNDDGTEPMQPVLSVLGPMQIENVNNIIQFDPDDTSFGSQISYSGTLAVQSANYEIDIYDTNAVLLTTITGSATNGTIDETWDLKVNGKVRNDDEFDAQIYITPTDTLSSSKVASHAKASSRSGAIPVWRFKGGSCGDLFTLAYGWSPEAWASHNARSAMIQNAVENIIFNPALDNQYYPTPTLLNCYDCPPFFLNVPSDKEPLLNDLANGSVGNFFFDGHGSDGSFGSSTIDGDGFASINNSEIGYRLGNYKRWKGKEHKHRYRLVILDTCLCGKSDAMASAFGIVSEVHYAEYFQRRGEPSQAMVAWPTTTTGASGIFQINMAGQHTAAFFNAWMSGVPLYACVNIATIPSHNNELFDRPWASNWRIFGDPFLTRSP